jgi:hypothetical protein
MTVHAALAAAATLVSTAFALSTFERWLRARKPHEAAWTAALALFAAGSAALWVASAVGWSPWSFRLFYLFGAVLNVPFLALGTVYLFASRRIADRVALSVVLMAAFAAGILVVAPLHPLGHDPIPQGSKVFGALPRVLAGVGSGLGATVVLAGAVLSAWRLLRARRTDTAGSSPATASPTPSITPGRLAAANLGIAAGTLVLGAGGLLNSTLGAMDAFSVSLVAGVVLLFGGFLLTNPPASAEGPAEHLAAHALGELVDEHHLVRALVAGEPLGAPGDDVVLLE